MDALNAKRERSVLLPIDWENNSTPEMGAHPQDILNNQLVKDADILIAIFKYRLGTPTPKASSGTVEEIEEFISAGKPVLLYFSEENVPRDKIGDQYFKLQDFRNSCKNRGLYKSYTDTDKFKSELSKHIAATYAKLKGNIS